MNGTLVVILNSLILLGIVASAIVAVQAKKLLDSVIALAGLWCISLLFRKRNDCCIDGE